MRSTAFIKIVLLSVTVVMAGCARAPRELSPEELRLRAAVIGTWNMRDQRPPHSMVSDQLQFFKNGDVTRIMVLEMSSGTRNQYHFSGTFEIVGVGKIRMNFGKQFGDSVRQIAISHDEMVLTESNGDYVKYARGEDYTPK